MYVGTWCIIMYHDIENRIHLSFYELNREVKKATNTINTYISSLKLRPHFQIYVHIK